jgi:hypothetical protein
VLQLQLVGANPTPAVVGLEPQAGHVNYLHGNDPAQWHTDVPLFGRVAYQQVYPGIDVVYYGNDQQQLEYDFDLAAGADPNQIVLCFTGAQGLEVNPQGDLVLHLAGGDVVQHAPVVYQDGPDGRVPVAADYVLRGDGTVGLALGGYDPARALVIDPALLYSTYLGGDRGEFAMGVAVDAAGAAYVTGRTSSQNLATPGALQGSNHGDGDVFVAKVSPSGALAFLTYLGGSRNDGGTSIALDGGGNVYVTGFTGSTDFPTQNALQPAFHGAGSDLFDGNRGGDAFVAKLNAAGSALVYATYLGGSGYETGFGIAVDGGGNAYVTGATDSTDFPTQSALQPAYAGGAPDGFVAKLNAAGSALLYSTYLGGGHVITSPYGYGRGIAVDSAGNAYVTGNTESPDFPTQSALQPLFGGTEDAFVTELNAAGNALVYSTFLGGRNFDEGAGIAVDSAGSAYVIGRTGSDDFPTVHALQPVPHGSYDFFVAKISPGGSALVYATYLGGSGIDNAGGIAVDAAGNAYVVGDTNSRDLPTASPVQAAYGGGVSDGFLAKLNAAGTALAYATYLGGSGADYAHAVAVDGAGNAYVAGQTQSTDFPTANALQPAYGGGPPFAVETGDAFVARMPDIGPLVYTAPAGTGHNLLLGLDGPTLRLMDNGALVATRPLANTTGVLVFGAANQPDALTLDNSAGLIALRDGVRFDGGAGGGNTAFLVGTPAGDTFTLTPTGFSLDGALASAFFNVQSVTAFGGPGDAAFLVDGPGNDLFVATPTYAYLQAGASLSVASGFVMVQANATAGSDLALLYDSAGADSFVGTPSYGYLTGNGFFNLAAGFAQVRGNSSGGGDVANLYDSAGDDVFRGTPTYSFLTGNGYLNLVTGFANVNAFAGAGGHDTADLYDSPGDDTFFGQDSVGLLSGAGYSLRAARFALVRATSSAGGSDHLAVGTIDYMFQPLGNWQ